MNPRVANICRCALPVVGLAAVWLSLFDRLQFPQRHTLYHLDVSMAGFAQAVYCIAFLLAALVFVFARKQLQDTLVSGNGIVAAFGAAGAIGVVLPVPADDGTGLAVAAVAAGALLVTAYITVHLVYWVSRAGNMSFSYIGIAVAASLGCYYFFDLVATLANVHSIAIPLSCPLVSSGAVLLLAAADRTATRHEEQADNRGAILVNVAEHDPVSPPEAPSVDKAVASLQRALDPVIASIAEEFNLSKREAELTTLAYGNFSARKISQELFIAESTVYTHLKRIYRKTGVHSKQELIELIDARK